MALMNSIRFKLQLLRYLIPNIYFNFHYLPFKQAYKLPIVFNKPHFGILKGNVSIKLDRGEKITHGMIKLGFSGVALYPNDGIRFQIAGGTVEFKGKCYIGSSSAIAVGRKGLLVFGDNFSSSAGIKIACQHRIIFEKDVLCGWEATFMDSDFHQLTSIDSQQPPQAYAPILIGEGCWFGSKTMIMKGTKLPDYCTVATNSMCNKEYTDNYTIYAGSPAKAKKTGYYRDFKNDAINYPDINE